MFSKSMGKVPLIKAVRRVVAVMEEVVMEEAERVAAVKEVEARTAAVMVGVRVAVATEEAVKGLPPPQRPLPAPRQTRRQPLVSPAPPRQKRRRAA